MRSNRVFLSVSLAIGLLALGASSVSAQPEARAEQSFEVTLKLLVGSNDGARTEISGDLAPVVKKLKDRYSFSGYRVMDTFEARMANGGAYEYKSVASGLNTAAGGQAYLEWSIRDLRSRQSAGGTPAIQAESFRFGARVPVQVGAVGENGPKAVFNYEQIGSTFQRLGVSENSPTVIGSLDLPGSGGTVFLVMTVRSIEM